jgi:hypothetical protein
VTIRHARLGDPEFGRTCACGRTKSKQAWKCQDCRTRDKRTTRAASVGASLSDTERRRQLDETRAQLTGELAALAAEQARDDRPYTRSSHWHLSLDAPTGRRGTTSMHEIIAA